MFKKILLVLLLAVLAIVGFAFTRPDTMRCERSVVMAASPAQIIPHLIDFKAWVAWSPYEGRDPDLKRGYEGAANGKGAVYTWEGNNKVGSGRMEITDVADTKVTIRLSFKKPMEAENVAEFILVPEGTGTKVTWAMSGPVNLVGKIFGIFMNMDQLIGADFEAGLAKLKTVVEKGAAAAPAAAPASEAAAPPAAAATEAAAAPASAADSAAPEGDDNAAEAPEADAPATP